MSSLALSATHEKNGAEFVEIAGCRVVAHYGDPIAEYQSLRKTAALLDLSFRGRICLTGADRVRLLHGQVTNDVQKLRPGQGCYAALVNAKGKIQSDLHICALTDELLLDFEPGLTQRLIDRFSHYVIADDVQVVDVAPFFGLLSVQGPRAGEIFSEAGFTGPLPQNPLDSIKETHPSLGEVYLVNQLHIGPIPSIAAAPTGYDLYIPVESMGPAFELLSDCIRKLGGSVAGWNALETARIEAGIPRFGADLDESNLAPEGGAAFVARAISYSKGCYIGQEVIARIRTYGQVSKSLQGLRAVTPDAPVPQRGDKLHRDGREVGYVTSATRSPLLEAIIALGHVRREHNEMGTELEVATAGKRSAMRVVPVPFGEEK